MAEETEEKKDIGPGDPGLFNLLNLSHDLAIQLRTKVKAVVDKLDIGDILEGTAVAEFAIIPGKIAASFSLLKMREHRKIAAWAPQLTEKLMEEDKSTLDALRRSSGMEAVPFDQTLAGLAYSIYNLNGNSYEKPKDVRALLHNAMSLLELSDSGFWLLVLHMYWFREFSNSRVTEEAVKNG